MSTGAAAKETLPLTAEQRQFVGNFAGATQMLAGLLLLVGAVNIVGGPLACKYLSAGIFNAILTFVVGALFAFLGLVMLAVSSDLKFLGQFPLYGGNHFRNAAKNLTAFYQVNAVLGVILALVALVRLFI